MKSTALGIVSVMLIVLGLTCWVRAEATLLQQTQAADVMSELLTIHGDQAIAQRDAVREYMEETGVLAEYTAHRPATAQRQEAPFADVFKGAVLFVQQYGRDLADESLGKMKEYELLGELSALQQYNLQQFVELKRVRDEIAGMKACLERMGHLDAYMRWAQDRPGALASAENGPTAGRVQELAGWIARAMGDIKAKAWECAEVKGMSRPDFEGQWQKDIAEMRQHMASRVGVMKQLAAEPENGVVRSGGWTGWRRTAHATTAGSRLAQAFAAIPLGPQDPRWNPYYYGPERLYSSWNAQYPEIYRPGIDGGEFRSYDLRVNTAFDVRLNGTLDRRQNTAGDRRLNFREDPRVHAGYGS